MSIRTLDRLYKFDTKKKLRVWYMEIDGDRYRTIAGLDGGSLVESEWTVAEPTNVGRANERSAEQQAQFEVEAAYTHKLTREYHTTPEAAKGGAHFFKPMLAKEYKADKFTPGYAQPKLDGVRCIATAEGLFSRQGKPIVSCPHIEEALRPVFANHAALVLDGELYNHALKDNFNELISLIRKTKLNDEQFAATRAHVQYHVYDVPSMAAAFKVRDRFARNLPASKCVRPVDTHNVESVETFDRLPAGSSAPQEAHPPCRAAPHCEQKRSKALLKRKDFMDDEFEVVAIEEGKGNWSGLAKRVVCKLPDGRTFGAGIRGTQERAKQLLMEAHKVVTVRYFALTPDGIPRFPVVTQFHGDAREL